MRIDGFSPAYVPNRTTRPDVSEVYDFAQRQQEARAREQQPEEISSSVRTDSHKAVLQISNESMLQQYQQRDAMQQHNLPHQVNKALASYNQTASFSTDYTNDANQVLGLDLYA